MRRLLCAHNVSWGPLFDGLAVLCTPQTGPLAPILVSATMAPHRKAEALADTFWILHGVRPDGAIVLRDSPAEDRWFEETLWVTGQDLCRSYAIVFGGQEYEFLSRVRLRNEKHMVYVDPEVQPSAEAVGGWQKPNGASFKAPFLSPARRWPPGAGMAAAPNPNRPQISRAPVRSVRQETQVASFEATVGNGQC